MFLNPAVLRQETYHHEIGCVLIIFHVFEQGNNIYNHLFILHICIIIYIYILSIWILEISTEKCPSTVTHSLRRKPSEPSWISVDFFNTRRYGHWLLLAGVISVGF